MLSSNSKRQPVLLEAMEDRLMFNHHSPAAYNLQDLMGLDQTGASWTYDSDLGISVLGDSSTASGITSVAVRPNLGRYGSTRAFLVDSSDDQQDTTATQAWYTDRKGTHLEEIAINTDAGTFDVSLNGMLLAPASQAVGGKAFRGGGSFTGKFRVDNGGASVRGTITGTASTVSKLTGVESVDVPAGSYSAVTGIEATTLSGTITASYGGKTYKLGYKATLSENFWAVPGVGVVKMKSATAVTISQGKDSVTAAVVANSALD